MSQLINAIDTTSKFDEKDDMTDNGGGPFVTKSISSSYVDK